MASLNSIVSSQARLFPDDCLLYLPVKCRAHWETLQRNLSGQGLGRSMGDVFQLLEGLQAKIIKKTGFPVHPETRLKGKTLEMFHQHHTLVFALARLWNGRPTLAKFRVKQFLPLTYLDNRQ